MYKNMAGTDDDTAFFTRNGVLALCRRGAAVKLAPQRWQDTSNEDVTKHDVVIAFEERIFDAVVEDLQTREPTEEFQPIHVICLDTKDNPQQAKIQGRIALELCWLLEKTAEKINRSSGSGSHSSGGFESESHRDGLVIEVPEILDAFQEERMKHTPIKVLHQLCYL